jgi:hypothetical protein
MMVGRNGCVFDCGGGGLALARFWAWRLRSGKQTLTNLTNSVTSPSIEIISDMTYVCAVNSKAVKRGSKYMKVKQLDAGAKEAPPGWPLSPYGRAF